MEPYYQLTVQHCLFNIVGQLRSMLNQSAKLCDVDQLYKTDPAAEDKRPAETHDAKHKKC